MMVSLIRKNDIGRCHFIGSNDGAQFIVTLGPVMSILEPKLLFSEFGLHVHPIEP